MRALVTGSAGFIGRHLCPALSDAGADVYTVDPKTPRGSGYFDDALAFFREEDFMPIFDVVFHLAANVGGRARIDGAPFDVLADNLELDAALFQWARRRRPRRVVFFSSSAVYPVELQSSVAGFTLREDYVDARSDFGLPDATYGFSKLAGERLALEARDAGIPVTVVRPFSGYGADQDLDYPFPAFIERARQRVDPFPIWGSGRQARDFVHVEDIIGAVMLLAGEGIDGPVNIATGRPTTFLELAGLVTAAAGYQPSVETLPGAPAGVEWRVGDPALLTELGYRPKKTLEVGIAEALA